LETIDFISILTIAFISSFGHCVGMCGGIVVAYSSTKVKQQWGKQKQSFAHLLYSFGRVTTYVTLGFVFGTIGGVATFNNTANGVMWIVAGVAMILTGLSLLGTIRFLTSIEHSISSSKIYKKYFTELISSNSLGSFYLLGLLNGLLPCGLVYFFAITAASSGSGISGALVMLVFGLATIPILFSLGFFVGIFKQLKFRNLMVKLSSILVILYGLYTIYHGYDYISNPEKTLSECHE
jgi:uncharacterized protein